MKLIRTVLTGLLLIPTLLWATDLPNLGSPERAVLSTQAEAELGQQFMIAVRNHFRLEQDPLITEYVRNLGQTLAAHSDTPGQPFYFFVIQNDSINAFAGPGGYIGIYTGTLATVQNEAELASVIAHEIGHVTQHHMARGIAQQKQAQYKNIATMIVGALIGSKNPNAGAGVMSGSQAYQADQYFKYSQSYEQEADRVGMRTLAATGYAPAAMPAFFRHLLALETLNRGNSVSDMLRTHPVTASRLADAENRAKQLHVKLRKIDPLELPLVQARVLVNEGQTAKIKPQTLEHAYAVVLILEKQQKYSAALAALKPLQQQYHHNLILEITEADIHAEAREFPTALSLLKKLYDQQPENPEVFLYYADTLIKAEQYREAAAILIAQENEATQDELYLYLLSQALGKSEQLSGAYFARAKLYEMYGNIPGAKVQLTEALKYAKPYEKRKIEEELRTLIQN